MDKKRLIAVYIILMTLPLAAHGRDIKKQYHKSFDAPVGSRLRLEHGDGDVVITPWNQDKIDIKVDYHASVSGFKPTKCTYDVQFDQQGKEIRVVEREKCSGFFGAHRTLKHQFTIQAPSHLFLSIRGSDGSLQISDWKQNIDCKTSDGRISLNGINGNVELHSSDGSVNIDNLIGNLNVKNSDGNVDISRVRSGRIDVTTSDGKIDIRDTEGDLTVSASDGNIVLQNVLARKLDVKVSDGSVRAGLRAVVNPDWRFKSSDGSIKIDVDQAISAQYEVHTNDGRINIDHPNNRVSELHRQHLSGSLNQGQGKISLSSSDGSVLLRAN